MYHLMAFSLNIWCSPICKCRVCCDLNSLTAIKQKIVTNKFTIRTWNRKCYYPSNNTCHVTDRVITPSKTLLDAQVMFLSFWSQGSLFLKMIPDEQRDLLLEFFSQCIK